MKIREQKRQSHAGCQMTIWNKAPKVSKEIKISNHRRKQKTGRWQRGIKVRNQRESTVERSWLALGYISTIYWTKKFFIFYFFDMTMVRHRNIPENISQSRRAWAHGTRKCFCFFSPKKNLILEIYLVDCVHRHTQQLRLSAVVVIWTIPSVSLTREAGPVDSHRYARPPSRLFFIQLIQHLTNENS